MATIASLNIALSADSARLKRDLDKAGKQSKTWAAKQKATFNSVGKSMGGMRTALAGVGAALGVGKLVSQADALGKNAKAAGLTVEAYQRLQFGLGQAGVSQAGFEKGQLKLNKVFADAGDGLAGAVDVLGSIGTSYEELAALAPEDRMLAVADALAGVEDVGLRAAYTAELLGKEFSKVTLDSDAIRKDGETISVVTQESADAAAASADSFSRLGVTMSNLATNILMPLMDVLTPVIESMASFATDNPVMASVIAGIVALGVAISLTSLPLVALLAAITAGVLVFQNWDKIVGFLAEKWDAFGEKFPLVASLIETALSTLAAPFIMIKDVIGSIFELFSGEGSFLDRLKAFGGNIVDALVTNNPVVKLMENLAGVIKAPLNVVIGMFENMVNKVIDAINDITKFELDFGMFGSISNEGTNFEHLDIPAFANGGWVSGPGTGTSDSIPALLSNGEFVVNAKSAKANASFLENINSGGNTISSNVGDGGGTSDGKSEGMQSFMSSFQSGLSEAFKSGDFKSFLGGVLDTFTSGIIDGFSKSITDSLFKNMDFGSLFGGGGGGGGFLSGLFGSGGFLGGLFGAADGGIVPTTPFSKSYADSVPTMLQPGELVVPKDQVGNFMGGGSGGGQVFNINVSGDVSRATRSEIVKMMPEIAAGTNMMNRENNVRR